MQALDLAWRLPGHAELSLTRRVLGQAPFFWFWPLSTVLNLWCAIVTAAPVATLNASVAFGNTALFLVLLKAGEFDDYGFGRWPGYTGE